jgi:hypothetical protein
MPSKWVSPVFAIWVLGLLLSPRAQAEPIPGPDLCLRSIPTEERNAPLPFRSSTGPDLDFRSNSAGCGSVLDSILGRGPWARVAGTAAEAGRLMLGLDLDLQKLKKLAGALGLAPAAPDRTSAGPQEAETEDEFQVKSHSSLVLRASRKRIFLGFGFQW